MLQWKRFGKRKALMELTRYQDPGEFHSRVNRFLLAYEAENNLLLGILAGLLKSEGARFAVQAIRLLIPNLEYLNIRHEVVQGAVPGLTSILITLGYVLLYVSGSIIIATMVFRRREL